MAMFPEYLLRKQTNAVIKKALEEDFKKYENLISQGALLERDYILDELLEDEYKKSPKNVAEKIWRDCALNTYNKINNELKAKGIEVYDD